jgi:hypothetical protein
MSSQNTCTESRAMAHGSRLFLGSLAAAAAMAFPGLATAAEVAGVNLEDSVKVAGKDLKLNGAGVRTRAVFKVYAMGLYLGKRETTVDGVLGAAGPRRFNIVMLREVSGEDFGQAFMTGINANTDKAEKGRIMNHMATLGEIFVTVGGLKKGDSMDVDWVPDKGTVIQLNGKTLSEPLPDVAFYNALLKIWLGDKPADSLLKPALLGAG